MKIEFTPISLSNVDLVLTLFRDAAEQIAKKNIDHWQYWKNPPPEKINWVKEGIEHNEFFFIKNSHQNIAGMVRILEHDNLYWGENLDSARYVHSLVILDGFKGLGKEVLQKIEQDSRNKGYDYLRLDCDSNNPRLCKYYEKQGFLQVGTKKLPLSTYRLYQKILSES